MDYSDASTWLFVPLQILFVDLLLGADNALVIALACRALPPEQVRKAAIIGVAGAIALRLFLTMIATTLLAIPLVKIAGGAALLIIAMNIVAGDGIDEDSDARGGAARSLWAAAGVIIIADAAMSLDNVVALAAIANGNFWLLFIGVALSLPVLAYGGILLTRLLQHSPGLIVFGAALLGWIAGGMILGDALLSPWAERDAPGLVALAPGLGALFVFLYGRYVAPRRPAHSAAPALVRERKVEPAPAPAPTPAPAPPTPYKLESVDEASAEPTDRSEPPAFVASRDDRLAIIGVLLLAIAAGTILMVASWYDSFN